VNTDRLTKNGSVHEQHEAHLEVVIPQGINERIQATVGKNGEYGEVVEHAGEVDGNPKEIDEEEKLVARGTHDKTSENAEKRHKNIALGHVIRL
jgi:hypothetical protein